MQLDFDLQGAPEKKATVFTVGTLTRRIRELLESGVGDVWVEGEISNLRRQASGHVYFTLKDATAQLACVLFAGQSAQIRSVNITDGVQVQIFGQITVYESRGQYQIIVRNVQARGAGALQAKFEELKARLAAEGLFDSARKRPLPAFAQRIGVVTSPTGAAIRDFLNVLHRRQRNIHVVINPVRVQGRGAAKEIAQAIRDFGKSSSLGMGEVDVIVVMRGGGSLEDLWEFNEEVVARAIAESPMPVVSAIGHEIDFTIADFAADVRAPTPSAAAEILSADSVELLLRIDHLAKRLRRALGTRLELVRERLEGVRRTALFIAPVHTLRELHQTLDRLMENLSRSLRGMLDIRYRTLERAAASINALSPSRRITETLATLSALADRMERACNFSASEVRGRMEKASALLNALDPKASLARGYTLTLTESGHVIPAGSSLANGDIIVTHFHDGSVKSVVKQSERNINTL